MNYKHLHIQIEDSHIAHLVLDQEGKTVNVLDLSLISELKHAVRSLFENPDIEGVLIRSAKPGQFIAGAAIDEIFSIKDPTIAADLARGGQELMEAIENLKVPTVALINGPCLGGGLELALACDYRVACENTKVKLALPEVQLGIIPGFGGTQRLPKIVGLINALTLITTGKKLDPKRALKMGLVDDICPNELLIEVGQSWIRKTPSLTQPRKIRGISLWMEKFSLTRNFILSQAKKQALKTTRGHYPAPIQAIEVLGKTYGEEEIYSYDVEAQKVGSLVASPISKSLIKLFFATENIKKDQGNVPPHPISRTAVLGAGVMGAGIAGLFADKGKKVRLKDISEEALAKGLRNIWSIYEKNRKKRREKHRFVDEKIHRISLTKDFSGFSRLHFVVEAIVEKIEVKQKVLAELAAYVPKDTIIASNTSALSLTEIASVVPSPERVVGMHFFNPVHKMPLIEIVQAEQTSEQTIASTRQLALAMGKTPIIVQDKPGFLVNRILGTYLSEAIRMAEEGTPVSCIEKQAVEFGMPMGPFDLFDEVGLDVANHVGRYLSDSFDYLPKTSSLISTMIQNNRFGKKNGKGFYKHQQGKKKLDESFLESMGLKTKGTIDEDKKIELIDRLILVMVNEAYRCLEENVVQSEQDVDVGTVLGMGFAPFRGGLISYARARSLEKIVARLEQLSDQHGTHFSPCRRLRSEK
ncbi:MAG: enoyl-CoA hydratase/isomerase family protein [Bdellovibrionales bacterium]|nr:enoyl-CoA hydratase/isomerase family protein [Bdellovibrionales bacterium]